MGDNEKCYCGDHIGNIERITMLEAESKTFKEDVVEMKDICKQLFERYNEQMRHLTAIKVCVENTSTRLGSMEEAIRLRAEVSNQKIKWADEKVKEVEDRLDVLDEFKWFRTWMTALRDNLLKYVFFAVLGILTLVAFFHRKDIFDIVSNYLKSK